MSSGVVPTSGAAMMLITRSEVLAVGIFDRESEYTVHKVAWS